MVKQILEVLYTISHFRNSWFDLVCPLREWLCLKLFAIFIIYFSLYTNTQWDQYFMNSIEGNTVFFFFYTFWGSVLFCRSKLQKITFNWGKQLSHSFTHSASLHFLYAYSIPGRGLAFWVYNLVSGNRHIHFLTSNNLILIRTWVISWAKQSRVKVSLKVLGMHCHRNQVIDWQKWLVIGCQECSQKLTSWCQEVKKEGRWREGESGGGRGGVEERKEIAISNSHI